MDLITALLYWVFRVMALKVIVLELGTWVNAASGYYMERRDTGVKVKERTERSWWAIKVVDCSEEICCWWLNCPWHKMAPWHNVKINLLMFVVYLQYLGKCKIYFIINILFYVHIYKYTHRLTNTVYIYLSELADRGLKCKHRHQPDMKIMSICLADKTNNSHVFKAC